MTRLVLGSGSQSRLALLRAAGLDPAVLVSGIDETALPGERTTELTTRLARQKAVAVAARCAPDALVIGCDSMLEVDGVGYGKPLTAERARTMWRLLAGHTAVYRTGHCLLECATGRQATGSCATVVHFGRPLNEEIEAYVATGEPLRVAGGFRSDGWGGWFVEGIEGEPSNLHGLSLPLLRRLLADWAMTLPGLWRSAQSVKFR